MNTEVSEERLSKKYWRATNAADLDFLTASYEPVPVNCHFHHGFTISAVEAGMLPLLVKDVRIDLRPGEILLLGPDVPHSFDSTRVSKGCSYRTLTRTLCDPPPWFTIILTQEPNAVCRIIDQTLWSVFLKRLQNAERGERDDIILLRELCRGLLSDISKNTVFKFDVRSQSIRLAKAYLDKNFSKLPGIRELSEVGGLSPRYFVRLFKEELGMTPHSYLNQLRINKAKEMLGMGFSMLRIAYDLGFFDQSHFSKTFSKITGVSPVRYLYGAQMNKTGVCLAETGEGDMRSV